MTPSWNTSKLSTYLALPQRIRILNSNGISSSKAKTYVSPKVKDFFKLYLELMNLWCSTWNFQYFLSGLQVHLSRLSPIVLFTHYMILFSDPCLYSTTVHFRYNKINSVIRDTYAKVDSNNLNKIKIFVHGITFLPNILVLSLFILQGETANTLKGYRMFYRVSQRTVFALCRLLPHFSSSLRYFWQFCRVQTTWPVHPYRADTFLSTCNWCPSVYCNFDISRN